MNNVEKYLNDKNWSPTSRQVDFPTLKSLLTQPFKRKLFHFHKWIYWTYGISTKKHRVCQKCFKKQVNRDPVIVDIYWETERCEDISFDPKFTKFTLLIV